MVVKVKATVVILFVGSKVILGYFGACSVYSLFLLDCLLESSVSSEAEDVYSGAAEPHHHEDAG